jgi:PKD repeat protein
MSYDGEVEPGESETVTVSFDPSSFDPGSWQITLPVESQTGAIALVPVDVEVGAPDPTTANFVADDTGGVAPFTVSFENTSTGPQDGYSWTFGDGETSTSSDPTHTYDTAGSYTVKLTVHSPSGDVVKQRNGYIVVSAPPSSGGHHSGGGSSDKGDAKAKQVQSDSCSSTGTMAWPLALLVGLRLLSLAWARRPAAVRRQGR